LQKPEGFRVKASEGEVVVLYFEPSATQDLKSSGFPDGPLPRGPKGQQHGNIDPILRIHKWRYRRYVYEAAALKRARGRSCKMIDETIIVKISPSRV
jgi:hypothetical protein